MNKITSKQKASIRKYAQTIKPLFQVGSSGIHKNNIEAIQEGFNQKEVLKVKVNREDKTDKKIVGNIATILEKEIPCEIAGVVGTTIIIYKENKNLPQEKKVIF